MSSPTVPVCNYRGIRIYILISQGQYFFDSRGKKFNSGEYDKYHAWTYADMDMATNGVDILLGQKTVKELIQIK